MRLAIIITHPIQYYSPVFKSLHERGNIEIKVFYTWGAQSLKKYDPGFAKKIEWDVPVLDGFPYEWAENISTSPGSHHFKGIITPGLTKQVEAWKADAVLVYGWGYNSHLKAIRNFKNRIPVFFRGDSTLLDEKKGVRSLLKSVFLRWVYSNIDKAFYVGTNSKAYFKKYGLKDEQLVFAPHAIDNDRFAITHNADAELLRKSLGIKDEELIVMFAGKLEEKKSPLLLLEAFLGLKKQGVHLLFVGNGPLENELKLKAADSKKIHFIDFQNQSQMPAMYQACDLFCLPSKGPGESWGLAINEAMACGKPILSSNKVGAAIDLVMPGKNGAIFKSGDLNNLILNLVLLIDKGEDGLAKMGDYSKQIIADWTVENQVKAIENVLKNE